MNDFRIPRPGDVLFFKSSRINSRAIRRAQKRMRLEHYEYTHAALVIDGDLVLESTTKYGVRKIRLSALEDPTEYLNAIVLRKAPPELSGEQVCGLVAAAFYFYKETYDWRGIVKRDAYSEGKSICSVFVKKSLLRSKQVPDAAFSDYREQIYPAELYSALIKAGYRKLADGYDLDIWSPYFSRSERDVDIIDISEDGRVQKNEIDNVGGILRRTLYDLNAIIDCELNKESMDLLKCIYVFEPVGCSFLDVIHNRFAEIAHHYAGLEHRMNDRANNWRDKSQYQDARLFHANMMISNCESTLKLVGTFHRTLLGGSLKDGLSQLQRMKDTVNENNREEITVKLRTLVTQRSALVAQCILDAFLVTRTTYLDHFESTIGDSRAKLQAYRKVVHELRRIEKLNFPLLDDVYESVIEVLELFLANFHEYENDMGKEALAKLAEGAKAGAEYLWSSIRDRADPSLSVPQAEVLENR
jgi:hypothetical protein